MVYILKLTFSNSILTLVAVLGYSTHISSTAPVHTVLWYLVQTLYCVNLNNLISSSWSRF